LTDKQTEALDGILARLEAQERDEVFRNPLSYAEPPLEILPLSWAKLSVLRALDREGQVASFYGIELHDPNPFRSGEFALDPRQEDYLSITDAPPSLRPEVRAELYELITESEGLMARYLGELWGGASDNQDSPLRAYLTVSFAFAPGDDLPYRLFDGSAWKFWLTQGVLGVTWFTWNLGPDGVFVKSDYWDFGVRAGNPVLPAVQERFEPQICDFLREAKIRLDAQVELWREQLEDPRPNHQGRPSRIVSVGGISLQIPNNVRVRIHPAQPTSQP